MRIISVILIILVVSACSRKKPEPVTKVSDYNSYLDTSIKKSEVDARAEIEFWSKRLRPDSSGVGDLGPLANAYTTLFDATGNVNYLLDAEELLKKALNISALNKDVYARALARNYISQHRFAEAREVLLRSYEQVSSRRAMEHMLFDVNMELGNYKDADEFLGKVKNNSDYNYLIRLSKWSDHKGDLSSAIKYMEKAADIAESRGSKHLMIWTFSNLGDYYGHDGRIEDAYNSYLKTLELQQDNAHAKKGIAWIAYSYEDNPDEAIRILDSVTTNNTAPDFLLLQAEIENYRGNRDSADKMESRFVSVVEEGNYGFMYTTALIELYAESDPEKAVTLAREEVNRRSTPETQSLLAYALLNSGEKKAALDLINNYVVDQTFEPVATYYSALVFKANGERDKVKKLKDDLIEASFELGPVFSKKVGDL